MLWDAYDRLPTAKLAFLEAVRGFEFFFLVLVQVQIPCGEGPREVEYLAIGERSTGQE
jgi:hypothetical protein